MPNKSNLTAESRVRKRERSQKILVNESPPPYTTPQATKLHGKPLLQSCRPHAIAKSTEPCLLKKLPFLTSLKPDCVKLFSCRPLLHRESDVKATMVAQSQVYSLSFLSCTLLPYYLSVIITTIYPASHLSPPPSPSPGPRLDNLDNLRNLRGYRQPSPRF